jgi:ArsR family transcriptional regulator
MPELSGQRNSLASPVLWRIRARVRIVSLLAERKSCICGEIVDHLPLAQSTVSQHLKVLRKAGIIDGEVDGPRVCYWINHAVLGRLKDLLLRL